MQHGEREVNCRGEGERGRERKKKMEEENLGFLSVDGYCATPKASKTNQVHLTPPHPAPAPPRGWSSSTEAELTSLRIHILAGGGRHGKALSPYPSCFAVRNQVARIFFRPSLG